MINRVRIRTLLASVIVLSWLYYDLWGGGINSPSWELRLMLLTALIWMFGESAFQAADLLRGSEEVGELVDRVGPILGGQKVSKGARRDRSDNPDDE